MLQLVLGALRRRPAQAAAVFALGVLLCAIAAAGPQFAAAAMARAAAADIDTAAPAQRLLTVRRGAPAAGDPEGALAEFRRTVEAILPPGSARPVLGLTRTLISIAGSARTAPVAYRDDACAHMRITGVCPDAAGEAVVSRHAANTLGVHEGDPLTLRTEAGLEVTLRVTGVYERADESGEYWAEPMFGPGRIAAGEESLDPVFVDLATFADAHLDEPTAVYTAPLPPWLVGGLSAGAVAERLAATRTALRDKGFDLVPPSEDLLRAVDADRGAIRRGLLAGWVQALALCWLALAVVGRHTAQDRRQDVALLKLRGATRRRTARLIVGQHLLPMLIAVPVGVPLGIAGARAAAGAGVLAADGAAIARLTAAAVAGALAAGVAVLALGEAPALRAPVAALLRRVPPRGSGRRVTLDVVVLAVAAAALYQVRASGPGGVGAAAPALVALAAATLLARLFAAGSARLGGGALRYGRVRLALGALRFSRGPGVDRIFVLMAVAVALLGLAAEGAAAGRARRAERVSVELGAGQVLAVQAANPTALLAAVRQADPQGRTAMAVLADPAASPPVLAVDAGRVAAVADWRAQYGAPGALQPPGPRPDPLPLIHGSALALTAGNASARPLRVLMTLRQAAAGADLTVALGPVPPGEHEVSAPVRGCEPPPGCRLVGLRLAGEEDADGRPAKPPGGSALTVRALRQQGPDAVILDAANLGDQRRWRGAAAGIGMGVGARAGALTLRYPQREQDAAPADNQAYVVDTPAAVPVILAGPAPKAWLAGDPALPLFGAAGVRVRVAATAPLLPVYGPAGVLADLDAVLRAAPDAGLIGVPQVWIARGTPPAAVDRITERLAAAGVSVSGADTATARLDRLGRHGAALAAGFQLLAAGAGLLLAAVAAAAAVTVQQRARVREWHALRAQGLPARAPAAVEAGGQAALAGLAGLGGVLVAVVADRLTGAAAAAVADDWSWLPAPQALRPATLGVVGLAAVAVLAAASGAALLPLARRLRAEAGR
ncbi:FtsX-like permease family protein [Dactylosporangium sp. NPDC048998]|uniref:FtsX-like permease family protein n=1 Tax=Dactylosporangium sp. NPDC048998 TaxID=3363976 RepID=UPI00371FB206